MSTVNMPFTEKQPMKLCDILTEAPYEIGSDAPRWTSDVFISDRSLARDYQHLGTLEQADANYDFWLTGNVNALVTVKAPNDIGQDSNKVVVDLIFQKPAGLPVQKELQVSTVRTDITARGKNLATALYIVLIRYGYTIVSDFSQYAGGKELWKKIARESDARKCVVRVWDDEQGDWIRDEVGEPVRYDAESLGDEQVWKDISRHSEATTLLVLSHR